MGSTRLPGKVMLELGGRPVIERMVERLRLDRDWTRSWLLRPHWQRRRRFCAICAPLKVDVFRGSPTDVLSLYAGAAHAADAHVVVRVTSDCPLLSPAITGSIIRRYLSEAIRDRLHIQHGPAFIPPRP